MRIGCVIVMSQIAMSVNALDETDFTDSGLPSWYDEASDLTRTVLEPGTGVFTYGGATFCVGLRGINMLESSLSFSEEQRHLVDNTLPTELAARIINTMQYRSASS